MGYRVNFSWLPNSACRTPTLPLPQSGNWSPPLKCQQNRWTGHRRRQSAFNTFSTLNNTLWRTVESDALNNHAATPNPQIFERRLSKVFEVVERFDRHYGDLVDDMWKGCVKRWLAVQFVRDGGGILWKSEFSVASSHCYINIGLLCEEYCLVRSCLLIKL